MKKRIILVLTSLLLVALLLVPTACIPKKGAGNPASTPIEQAQSRIASLESKVASLTEKISTAQNPPNQQPAIDQLRADLTATNAKITELQAKVKELEVVKQKEAVAAETITRWYEDIATTPSDSITFTSYIRPSKIEEDGDYDIRITLFNNSRTRLDQVTVAVTFTPKSGARVYVDDKNTFFDAVASPFVMWDTEVITRGDDKYARRITCTSDYYSVPAGTPGATDDVTVPGTLELKLVFSLAYK